MRNGSEGDNMRKNGCRARLTFTFLTLAIEHKFVNEQKKNGEDYSLLALRQNQNQIQKHT